MSNYISFNSEIKLFLLISLYIIPNISSNIYPIYKLILEPNLNYINSADDYISYNFFYSLNTKGVGIIFNNNSEINSIPYHLFKQLVDIIDIYIDGYSFIKTNEKGYQELLLYGYLIEPISLHFITENIGITIPNDIFFQRNISYMSNFTFLSKENQENIVIGKYLMDLMKIEFNNQNEFIINNKDFIYKMDEEL